MNNEYNYPTQTFRFAVTFEYEVTAYNAKQAYEMINNLDITSEVKGSRFISLGRRSPKQMREIMKRVTRNEFEERPDYYSNATAMCSVRAKLVGNPDDWRKPHQSIKYLGKVKS